MSNFVETKKKDQLAHDKYFKELECVRMSQEIAPDVRWYTRIYYGLMCVCAFRIYLVECNDVEQSLPGLWSLCNNNHNSNGIMKILNFQTKTMGFRLNALSSGIWCCLSSELLFVHLLPVHSTRAFVIQFHYVVGVYSYHRMDWSMNGHRQTSLKFKMRYVRTSACETYETQRYTHTKPDNFQFRVKRCANVWWPFTRSFHCTFADSLLLFNDFQCFAFHFIHFIARPFHPMW